MKTFESNKKYMEAFIAGETGIKPPVGFWYHFVPPAEHHYALTEDWVMPAVLEGQKKFIDQYQPDFIKIMCDGFFSHPSMLHNKIDTVNDLDLITPADPDSPWFSMQVNFVRQIREHVGPDQMIFYSIFSPLNYIRLRFDEVENDNPKFARLFLENPGKMIKAANIIAEDVKKLLKLLKEDGAADGYFYSLQSVQDDRADDTFHEKYVRPSDLMILEEMKSLDALVLLHICGYGEFTNPIHRYVDYPADIINWATHTEKLTLAEGIKRFGGRPVLGGFDNNPGTLLYTASEDELKKEVYQILDEAKEQGVVVGIGADCTVSADIEAWRISFVQDTVKEYYHEQTE